MISAMARLPCNKQTQQQQQIQQQPRHHVIQQHQQQQQRLSYWDPAAVQHQQQQQQQQPAFIRTHHRHRSENIGKRKSAVELLQETKAFYVKSEIVLDRKQELKNSGHLQVSQISAPSAPPRLLRKSSKSSTSSSSVIPPPPLVISSTTTVQTQTPPPTCCWNTQCHENDRIEEVILSPQRAATTSINPKSPRIIPIPQRRKVINQINIGTSGNTGGEQLQTKLRRLLNTDSKENVFFPDQTDYSNTHHQKNQDVIIINDDNNLKYSSASLSPTYDDRLQCILPEVPSKFNRSNSQSYYGVRRSSRSPQEIIQTTTASSKNNEHGSLVICHKSLPDLHSSSSGRRRASLSPRSRPKHHQSIILNNNNNINTINRSIIQSPSQQQQHPQVQISTNICPDCCDTSSDYSEHSFRRDSNKYRSSRRFRRSPGSGDASSVLSSGGRTHKSSGSSKISHGPTARDSGGSSGHCTHRSDPPTRIQDCWNHARRDSGASTQHSTERDRSRKSSYNGGTLLPAISRKFSPDSESSEERTNCSPTKNSRFSDSWKEGRGRPILRSKSDISDRYWRYEASGRPNKSVSQARSPRSLSQLENFFDRLGLDEEEYQRISQPDSQGSSPVFFDSVSSVDSGLRLYSWGNTNEQWISNCQMGGNATQQVDESLPRSGDQLSIVERNARIIKWLHQNKIYS